MKIKLKTHRSIVLNRLPVQALVTLTRCITVLILLKNVGCLNVISRVVKAQVNGFVSCGAQKELHTIPESCLQGLALGKDKESASSG